MKLKIEKVFNGYLLKYSNWYQDPFDGVVKQTYEVQVFEERNCELEPIVDLLYSLSEQLGFPGSKHDEKRIWIEIKRGDGTAIEGES